MPQTIPNRRRVATAEHHLVPRSRRRRRAAILGVLLAAGITLGAALVPAQAHSSLVSSDPADGASIEAPPAAVTLVFNENLINAGASIVATGATGSVPLLNPTVSGQKITAGWRESLPGGRYTVAYRVVSADGHPITGTIAFTITGGQPTATNVPTPTDTGVYTSSPTQTPPPPTTNSSASPASSTSGPSPWPWAIAATLLGAAVLAVVIVLARRRGRRQA